MPSVLGNTTLDTRIALESDLEQSLVAVTGAPFDAELEYVTVPDGTCINTEITSRGAILQWEATIRMPSTFDTTGNFRFGSWTGNASESTMVWMSSGPRKLDIIVAGDRYISDWSAITGQFGKIGYDGMYVFCGASTANGPSQGSGGGASKNNFPFTLFGLNGEPQSGNIGGDISSARFSFCNSPVRDFIPVRVGTVGYLFDKISGRLFGSAVGSIPLVPGPDVSTPTFTPKTEIDLLAPLASPAFTGTPTAPTAASGTNTTQVATTAFVQSAVSGKADANHMHSSIVSTDGNTSVTANNDGTATIEKTTGLRAVSPGGSIVQFENTASELASGVSGGISFTFDEYNCTAPLTYVGSTYAGYGPISGGPWVGEESVEIDQSAGVSAFFGDTLIYPWTTTTPGGTTTKAVATTDQIPTVPDLDLSIVSGKLCVTFEE